MKTSDKLRHFAAKKIGYTVRGHGYDRKHYTLTIRAALDWAACYKDATITKSRNGEFVASKRQSK